MENENREAAVNIEGTAKKAAEILLDKKALDVEILYVNEQTIIADYFVIAHGTSNTQVRALADEVVHQMQLLGHECLRKEGYESAAWILLDFASVIVHIFQKETRDHFKLEKLWADAARVETEK